MVSSDSAGSPSTFRGPRRNSFQPLDITSFYVRMELRARDEESLPRWEKWANECSDLYLKDLISRDTYRQLMTDGGPKLMSETFHRQIYIPLRNQDRVVQIGQQFDLRRTLEEFERKVYAWKDWKPGMEIHVSLVRGDEIPSYLITKPNHNEVRRTPERCSEENNVGHELGTLEGGLYESLHCKRCCVELL